MCDFPEGGTHIHSRNATIIMHHTAAAAAERASQQQQQRVGDGGLGKSR